MGRKLIDLTGQTFGRWHVLERAENKGNQPQWKCECSCEKHTIKIIPGSRLRAGTSKSCGCLASEIKQTDITNQKFGKLTALEPTEKRTGTQVIWKCKCDCGNICYVGVNNLKTGHTLSCGCNKKEHNIRTKDLTNQQFGLLIALEPTEDRNFSNIIWKCKCQCGNICYVPSNRLLMGKTKSCGCLISKGEQLIKEILINNNIDFIPQYSFKNCYFPDTGYLAKFDFYIQNKYLIEFDGIQHYLYSDSGWNNKENFLKVQEHDNFKNQWCKNNNIPLIRIPYTHYDNLCLEDLLLETSKFIVN